MDVSRRSRGLAGLFLVVFSVFLLLAPAAAQAQGGGDPVVKVTNLNKRALDAYARRDYESARSLLKQALDLCNAAGLDSHPIKARTHIHFGAVTIVGFKQRELGLKHFRKALEIQPEIKLTKQIATPELQEIFEEAMASTAAGGPEGGGGGPQAQDEGQGGAAAGGEGAPAQADDEGGAPSRPRRPPPKKKKRADEEVEEGDEDEEAPAYRIYIGIAIGSGAGIATGSGELNPAVHKLSAPGFAAAQLGHISPEVGFFVNPSFMLSLRGRFQYVSGLTGEPGSNCTNMYCNPGNGAFAGFLRGSFFVNPGDQTAVRLMFAGELGGGYIRHAQVFPNDTNCGMPGAKTQCVDSLAGGPFLFGPAFGVLWDLGKAAGLMANVAVDLGVPKFTANFDLNLGLALHF
jgi:hypothetical protein